MLNQLYEVSRLFQNFFQPVMKLQRKQRIGGRIQRLYDVPQTPYERLAVQWAAQQAGIERVARRVRISEPGGVAPQLSGLREQLFDLADRKLPVVMRPKHRGPGVVFGRQQNRGLA